MAKILTITTGKTIKIAYEVSSRAVPLPYYLEYVFVGISLGATFFFPFKEYENIRTKEIHRTEVIIKIRMGDTLTMAIAHVNVCKEIRITIK